MALATKAQPPQLEPVGGAHDVPLEPSGSPGHVFSHAGPAGFVGWLLLTSWGDEQRASAAYGEHGVAWRDVERVVVRTVVGRIVRRCGVGEHAFDLLADDANLVHPLVITVDPERDTPEVMADYVDLFHPRIVGLTGTPEQVAGVAKAYRVYYAKRETGDGPYLMDHSAVTYLMGPDGGFLTHFSRGTAPEEIAETIRQHVAEAS